MASSSSAAAAGALGITMVAVTCGATAIAALLLSQHEKQEDRLAEALRMLAQKEEQLQQACRERSRLCDQLTAALDQLTERAARTGTAERSASSVSTVSTVSTGPPVDGQHSDVPKPLQLDPRVLGLIPHRPSSSASPQQHSTRGSTERVSQPVATDSGATQPDSPSHDDVPRTAGAELAELRQADVEGAVQFLHVRISAPAFVLTVGSVS